MNPDTLDEIFRLLKHENQQTYSHIQFLEQQLVETKTLAQAESERNYKLKQAIHHFLKEIENI